MSNRIFEGVRVVEVAQYVFVPATGSILADLGADVIKVEAPSGDVYRHLVLRKGEDKLPVNVNFELNNRGKRSLAIDLKKPEGLATLHKLVAKADVFLTNFRPDALERLNLGVKDLQKVNPKIVYARGHGFGRRGPQNGRPGYDATAFWARGGFAHILTPEGQPELIRQRGAFGDHTGAMNLAMGVAGALFARERTGKPQIVDVSLLATGMWVLSSDIVQAQLDNWIPHGKMLNPLTNSFRTKDGRFIQLILLEPDRYWKSLCEHVERPDLVDDPRFREQKVRGENAEECIKVFMAIFATRTFTEWVARLQTFDAPWEPVASIHEVLNDPQALANNYVFEAKAATGESFKLVAAPVEFNETPAGAGRAPKLGEHTDAILRELGTSDAEISAWKKAGVLRS